MTRTSTRLALATALVAGLALAGCKKDAPAPATPPPAEAPATAPAPAPAAPAPATASLTVTGVDLGNAIGSDARIAAPTTTFAANDTIHASVATDGAGPGKVDARWTFGEGADQQVVHTEAKDVPAGPQVTEFRIQKPDGWPVGKYSVEVSVDGNIAQTRPFEVK